VANVSEYTEGAKAPVDWVAIEMDYRAGVKPLRQIGNDHGVSHVAVSKRAKRDGWTRDLRVKVDRSVPVRQVTDGFDGAGFVYLLLLDSGVELFYKIGMANHLDARMKSHQTSCPFELRVAIAYYTPNMRHEERELHEMFAAQRVRGEWFNLDRSDLEAIAARSLLS